MELTPPALKASFPSLGSDQRAPVYLQLASSNGEIRYQLMAGANPVSLQGLEHSKKAGIFLTTPKERSQAGHPDRPSSVVARFEQQAAQGGVHMGDGPATANFGRPSPSLSRLSTSHPAFGVPAQPQSHLTGAGPATTNSLIRPPSTTAGLGLLWQNRAIEIPPFDQSPTPTVPDDPAEMARLLSIFPRSDAVPSTAPHSFQHRDSPQRDFAMPTWNAGDPTLPLTIPLNVQAPPGYTDLLPNATEANTPSSKATPDLSEVQAYLREAQSLSEVISRRVTPSGEAVNDGVVHQQAQSSGTKVDNSTDVSTGPVLSTDVVVALRKLPDVLQNLIPQFGNLLTHLSTYPNLSTSHQALTQRVEALQNASFDHVTPEEFLNRYEHLDARLLEMEGKIKEHEDYHAALDEENSSVHAGQTRQLRGGPLDATTSFTSALSGHSNTSSALLQAAVDRLETETKLKDFEDRIEVLESAAPPSVARPWEIEVVLLPWGRPLRGIWTSMDEAEALTQNSAQATEEWNQTRSVRSTTQSFSSAQVGWSSQAIHDWADASDEWLSPRACGPTGMVYKRLRSRGFVKKVSLVGSGAAHVHAIILAAFKPLLDRLEELNPELEELGVYEVGRTFDPGDHHPMTSFLGLREPIIPLRKVHKSSRLRFLAASELATPALWDASFLSSGIMMRAPGGQKRLFVTTRAAYHQRMDGDQDGWTWQKLRELPRVTGDEGQNSDEPSHVGEADAKEPCWAHNENLDPPPSAQSSFNSVHSGRSSHADNDMELDATSEDAVMDDPLMNVIHDSTRNRRMSASKITASSRHQRTTSVPLAVGTTDTSFPGARSQPHGDPANMPKRRVISFEQVRTGRKFSDSSRSAATSGAEADQPGSESPSRTHRSKRRRFSRTQSADAVSDTTDQQFLSRSGLSSIGLTRNLSGSIPGLHEHRNNISVDMWPQPTPRRSREPPSPFIAGLNLSTAASEAGPSTGSLAGHGTRYAAWEVGAGNGVDPLHASDGPMAAYATPFSAGECLTGYGGDTQADNDSLNQRYVRRYDEGQEDDEDDWEGVDEQQGAASVKRKHVRETNMDDDNDEEDSSDGEHHSDEDEELDDEEDEQDEDEL